MAEHPIETVRIKVVTRDGRLYVSSDDVPGLWLWGKDPEQVFKNIGPAIRVLYKYNRGMEVEVRETFLSKLQRWILIRLFRVAKQSDRYKIYPLAGHHLTNAHG